MPQQNGKAATGMNEDIIGKVSGKVVDVLVPVSNIAALVLFVYAVVMTAIGRFWISQLGDFSSVGLASVCILYIMGGKKFREEGLSPGKSIVLALLFGNAFLQSYEIIYNLSFLPAITGDEVRAIVLLLVMLSPLFLMREYLRFNARTSLPLLVMFAATWAIWVLFGFPQYYTPGYRFPRFLSSSDPYSLSLLLNYGTKAILASFFASLAEPSQAINGLFRWGRGATSFHS